MSKSIKLTDDFYIAPEAISGYVGTTNLTMDNIKLTGVYYVWSSTNPTLPYGDAGYLLVLARQENYVKQFYSPFNSNWIYVRTCNNGTWTSWQYCSFGN